MSVIDPGRLPMMILIAGPYRSGTNDEPARIHANMEVMTQASLAVFRLGHLPIMGEALALPMIEAAGSQRIGDAVFDEIFHPIARRLFHKLDAVLRVGGPSAGADEMVQLARDNRLRIFHAVHEIEPL